MNKQFLFIILLIVFLFPSCAKLVNGDIDETIEEHLAKEGDQKITVNYKLCTRVGGQGITGSLSISSNAVISDLISAVNSNSDITYTAVYIDSEDEIIKCSSNDFVNAYTIYFIATEWVETLTDLANTNSFYDLSVGNQSSSNYADYEKVYVSGMKYYAFDVTQGSSYSIQWADYDTNCSLLTDNGYSLNDVIDGKYTVYNSSGKVVLTGGDSVSQTFTASYDELYIICIKPYYFYDSGTVAICVYSH